MQLHTHTHTHSYNNFISFPWKNIWSSEKKLDQTRPAKSADRKKGREHFWAGGNLMSFKFKLRLMFIMKTQSDNANYNDYNNDKIMKSC